MDLRDDQKAIFCFNANKFNPGLRILKKADPSPNVVGIVSVKGIYSNEKFKLVSQTRYSSSHIVVDLYNPV